MAVPKKVAIVLAGAVAKGAFEAGAIQALSEAANIEIVRIVASSSGALNGTVLAGAIRSGTLQHGAATLVSLWNERAEWYEVFDLSLVDLLKRDGVSSQRKLVQLLRSFVTPTADDAVTSPIQLRLIVAPIDGTPGMIGDRAATTYESIQTFDGEAFDSAQGLEQVFAAATASAAFPLLFAPVSLPGLGPCVDGGLVNNTPIKWALDGAVGADVEAIVVVSSSVALRTKPAENTHGTALIGHLADMLIGERLFRDLREATTSNAQIDRLANLVHSGVLSSEQLGAVFEALAWDSRRRVEVVEIRPTEALHGSAFSGFFDARLRKDHIAAGLARGRDVLRAFD